MQCTGFYRVLDKGQNDFCDLSDSLIVNCTGHMYKTEPFNGSLKQGRKDYYIFYINEGHLTVYINKQPFILSEGMGFCYYPNHPFTYDYDGTDVMSYYWVHFTGNQAENVLKRFGIYNESIFNVGVQTKIIHIFEKMASEMILREEDFAFSAATYLLQILVEIKRYTQSPEKTLYAQRLKNSMKKINNCYQKELTVEELAAMENLSVSRYRVIFKKLTGMSPKQYLTEIRMRRACELLIQTNVPISSIGKSVGYNDSLYFFRIFKKYNNMTPSLFRENHIRTQL